MTIWFNAGHSNKERMEVQKIQGTESYVVNAASKLYNIHICFGCVHKRLLTEDEITILTRKIRWVKKQRRQERYRAKELEYLRQALYEEGLKSEGDKLASKDWRNYIAYLQQWASAHTDISNYGKSPASFEEFSDETMIKKIKDELNTVYPIVEEDDDDFDFL